ncbi:MAG: MiaB/RimO family radical SAM methylthiotransferase, partial [Anaerococcus sp.]|nr:MiaB/RimO family radical SAM methylthiotransferase [Anaerococcus sp.]
ARGNIASRDLVSIIDEAKRLSDNGYKEIVLTGIHVASYGKDFDLDISLIDVIEHIAKIEGIERIRLSSMEPRHIDREFLQRMKDTKKACDHFHLSLQSGSDDVLKLMNRKYNTKIFKEKVDLIREYFPNAGLTTDIIVGFPNESEKNHEETKKFVKEIKFSKTHLFKYSKRDGTKAANMKNQVDGNIKKRRSKELSIIEKENSHEFLDKQIGKTLSVLFETKTELDGYRSGYSTNYLRVHTKDKVEINEIKDVKITQRIDDYLIGQIIS